MHKIEHLSKRLPLAVAPRIVTGWPRRRLGESRDRPLRWRPTRARPPAPAARRRNTTQRRGRQEQRLLGYFVHEPNLGSLEGQDPIRLLTGELTINGHFSEFLPDEVKPLLAEHRARLKAA